MSLGTEEALEVVELASSSSETSIRGTTGNLASVWTSLDGSWVEAVEAGVDRPDSVKGKTCNDPELSNSDCGTKIPLPGTNIKSIEGEGNSDELSPGFKAYEMSETAPLIIRFIGTPPKAALITS